MQAWWPGISAKRWASIGRTHGMEVQILAADLTAVKPKALQAARDTNPRKIRVAFVPWLRSLALPLLATARS